MILLEVPKSAPRYSDWQRVCGRRLVDPAKAIAMIRPGERIFVSSGSAVPLGMYPYLCDESAPLGDNAIFHLLTLGEAPYAQPKFAGRFRHNALFIGPNVREAVGEGRADFTPVYLSEIPMLIRSRRIPIDVAIVSVSPPDADGWCTFGTHVDIAPAACEAARLIIAQVNTYMPRTCGPERIHVDRIHAMCDVAHPLPVLKQSVNKAEAEEIGRHIAELIPDGATLQLGIGGIPDGVLRFITDRKDLGIHTEMFSDGVVDLVERGVITGRANNLHPGKLVASFVMGTEKTYNFVHNNPMVELYPVDYSNDPFVIGQNNNMIAINTCLQVDLTGQVCSDSIGEKFYSGIGGQVDFIRGAARSNGGKPIIALPSTASGGIISRIVPRLDDGAGVVTTRGDVHWVVTEYGAVNLHGLNARERAMALVSIAHPKFRPWLLAEAKQRRLIYLDQLEPPVKTPIYPKAIETRSHLKDGTAVWVRAIKPTDEKLLQEMFYRLSRETIHSRFFSAQKYMPHNALQRFCTIDYERDMTLVALVYQGEIERAVGWAQYSVDPNTHFAEAAFVVDDAWQGRGVGTLLMRRLTEVAEARGVDGFTAVVLAGNTRMMRVFEKCGYPIETLDKGESIHLRIPFTDASRPTWQDVDQSTCALRDRPTK
ncbi:MAG: GNAT family N-acetyltransferase [Phycisphaerae bacterium]|jgi:acyl-CoA hydrolase/GNAT superfamily N-acetyltransferase